jgi:anti-sigma regulatory factor (Ser/Thr protein kinase)
MSETRTSLALGSDVKELARVSEALAVFCRDHGLPDKLAMELNIVLDETLTNTMFYGAEENEDRHRLRIRVDLEIVDDALIVRQEDNGKAFDPLQVPEANTAAPLDQRAIGGLGIHLVRKLMDEVAYARTDGSNVLTMKKYLAARS